MKNKYIINIATVIFFIFITYSCEKGVLCIKGKGNIKTETRMSDKFKKIHLFDSDASVIVVKGLEHKIELRAQENILELLKTSVRNDVLEIELDKCVRKNDNIGIQITCPHIEGVKVSSEGSISIQSTFSAENFEVRLSGSGSISLDTLFVDQFVKFEINGNGNVDANGVLISKKTNIVLNSSGILNVKSQKSLVVKVVINGAGSVYINKENECADNFSSDSLLVTNNSSGLLSAYGNCAKVIKVKTYGSGQCLIFPIEKLLVDILGNGDIIYKGTPYITKNISGYGNLIKAKE